MLLRLLLEPDHQLPGGAVVLLLQQLQQIGQTVQKLMEKKYLTNVVYDGSADRFMAADHVERKAVREEEEAQLDFDAIDTRNG